MNVEKKKAEKVLLIETCLVTLQPATDDYYEPLETYITKFSRVETTGQNHCRLQEMENEKEGPHPSSRDQRG
jgi:hypothetical protein